MEFMTELTHIDALRYTSGMAPGDCYYVKGHSVPGDGGGGVFTWRVNPEINTRYSIDNDGTIIKSQNSNTGRWVRQYDGYINVLFFGAYGLGGNYNDQIQRAIDFAELNTSDVGSVIKSSTVFIPNGSYVLWNIMLKSGVTILGESIDNTIIYATTDGEPTPVSEYLFRIETGPVIINISNLKILGLPSQINNPNNVQGVDKGCFMFDAKVDSTGKPGGLWYSTMKNIAIGSFLRDGIYIKGGKTSPNAEDSPTPNQFNIFENVRVTKGNDTNFSKYSQALKMTGQNGQHTFINCEFDGYTKTEGSITTYDKVVNVLIENDKDTPEDYLTSNVITFLNCTIQNSDYGVNINYAENVTFDNCWFENLGVALTIGGNKERSKSINILNSRFANAAGFGKLYAPNNIKNGQCINVSKAVVNIYNNYVAMSGNTLPYNGSFIFGAPDTFGINCYNNTFRDNDPLLSRTYGVMQTVTIDSSEAIDCKSNKLVFVNPNASSPTSIKNINSAINAGEILHIRANGLTVTFQNTGNIYLTNRSSFTLLNGEIASFIKIDVSYNSSDVTYQLLSFTKTTP